MGFAPQLKRDPLGSFTFTTGSRGIAPVAEPLKGRILEAAERYLSHDLSIRDFWTAFQDLYFFSGSSGLTEYDSAFFDELNDVLHYTDFQSPPDPALHDERQVRTWLQDNLPLFKSGKWKANLA